MQWWEKDRRQGDLWSYPLSLGTGGNKRPSPSKECLCRKLRGVVIHSKHCFRKVSIAAVPDELMREGTKAKVWGHLLYP